MSQIIKSIVQFFLCFALAGFLLSTSCKPNEEPLQDLETKPESHVNPVNHFSKTITIDELKDHISYLASDELEGRRSGTQGARLAAQYIAGFFKDLRLKGLPHNANPHVQPFPMVKKKPVDCYLESEHGRVDNWDEFMELHCDFYGEKAADMVFAGYGSDEDLANLDVRGKLTAFFMGRPDADEIGNDLERVKMASAMERGAIGTLLIVHDDERILEYIRQIKPYFNKPRYYQDLDPDEALHEERNIIITTSAAAKLFGVSADALRTAKKEQQGGQEKGEKFKTKVRMKTSYEMLESLHAENILGYIEGSDKKEECVIVTAHYDHLGKSGKQIYNGAYDNAAGVAAVMEIAEAFVSACEAGHSPRRSLVYLIPDAEEIGGVGSIYYLDHPIFPPEETVVDINIDGIGREDASRLELKNFVHVYLSRNGRTDLKKMRDRAAEALSIDLRLEWRENYAGSDNVFFERDLIPAVALGTGQPKDHHEPTDTANKIRYANVQKIAQLAFAMVWETANSETSVQRKISE